jgi:hypothetical protein
MDIEQDMDIESEEIKPEEDTRSIQDILSELTQKTENCLNIYNAAIQQLESINRYIDNNKDLTIKGKLFTDFIQECATISEKNIIDNKYINFGELLLKGLNI